MYHFGWHVSKLQNKIYVMSQIFAIKQTKKTPSVTLDHSIAKLDIVGNSVLEDSKTFYEPIIKKIEEYLKTPQKETTINFKLGYLCTGSSKFLFQIISKFKNLHTIGKYVHINWYYIEDDIDMFDMGKAFEEITQIPTSFISLSE